MGTGRHTVFSCAANFLRGRKCIFCGSLPVLPPRRGYVKWGRWGNSKSLRRLRRESQLLPGFYQLHPAYRLSQDLGLDVKGGPRSSHRIREALYHVTELEAGQLKGASELEEADCGGTTERPTRPRHGGQKRRGRASGAGGARVHKSCPIGQCGGLDAPYSGPYAERLGLFSRCLPRVAVVKTLWQTSYGESCETLGGSADQESH